MKKFINNILYFALIPGLILIIILLVYLNKINDNRLASYRIKTDINSIIIGGSQIQMAFDDKKMKNCLNLSLEAESYPFTYYKLKGILSNNKSIKYIYLGYSYFCLSDFYDEYIDGKYSKEFFSRYFFLLPTIEQKNLLKKNMFDLPSCLIFIISNGFKNTNCNPNQLSFIGSYQNGYTNTSADKYSIFNRTDAQYYLNHSIRGFSTKNIHYLQKIILLCKMHSIELIGINPPLHNFYKKRIPEIFKRKYKSLKNKYKLNVIDLSNFPLKDSCFLPDGSHVNKLGADFITHKLNEEILKSKESIVNSKKNIN